ncbi:hypothetical protein Tco_0927023 [Tanacetum coccineum]|uniref:RNA-directed DNA polymerase, eukaryota, reverse transcriptase zinc-binding domain protein n=1 Tax=Tanacetum coccineum TaxID=301880 RepID=A0ABQ5DC84_9ASTR
MRTRSQSRRRRQQQQTPLFVVENFDLEEPIVSPNIVPIADNRTMAQMLQAPIEGYEDAIVVPPINANNFELKQPLINLVQSNKFTGLLRQCPHHGFWELHQLDTFYNSLNSNDQDALDSVAGEMPQEGLAIIESKSKVRYSRSRANDSRVSTDAPLSTSSPSNNSFDIQQIAASLEDKMTIKMNQMMNEMKALVVTTPATVKAVEEVCVELELEVSKDEVKRVVWDCGTDKAPGPDGFTFGFYRRFWKVIENDVFDAVNHFFTYGDIPKGCNSSFIALIPKIPDANVVESGVVLCIESSIGMRLVSRVERLAYPSGKWKMLSIRGRLESIRSHFFNGHDPNSKRTSWVKWKNCVAIQIKVALAIHGEDGKVGKQVKSTFPSYWMDIVHEINVLKNQGWYQNRSSTNLYWFIQDVNLVPVSDRWKWSLENSGDFSVASVRKMLDDKMLSDGYNTHLLATMYTIFVANPPIGKSAMKVCETKRATTHIHENKGYLAGKNHKMSPRGSCVWDVKMSERSKSKTMRSRSFNLAKLVVKRRRKRSPLDSNCDVLLDEYKVEHVCNASSDGGHRGLKMKGKCRGVLMEIISKEKPCVIGLRETKSNDVEEQSHSKDKNKGIWPAVELE